MESGLNIQIKMSAVLSESLRILGGYLGLLSLLSENYYSSEGVMATSLNDGMVDRNDQTAVKR